MKVEKIVFSSLIILFIISILTFLFLENKQKHAKFLKENALLTKGDILSCIDNHTIKKYRVKSDYILRSDFINLEYLEDLSPEISCSGILYPNYPKENAYCVKKNGFWVSNFNIQYCQEYFKFLNKNELESFKRDFKRKEIERLSKTVLSLRFSEVSKSKFFLLKEGTQLLCRENGLPVIEILKELRSGSKVKLSYLKPLNSKKYRINDKINRLHCTVYYEGCWMTDKGLLCEPK